MKRHFSVILLILPIILTSACAPAPEVIVEIIDVPPVQRQAEPTSSSISGGNIVLTSSLWDTPEEQAFFLTEIIDPFEDEYDVDVSFQTFDSQTLYDRAVIQQSSGNITTDLFITSLDMMDDWIAAGYTSPLDTVLAGIPDREFSTGFDRVITQGNRQYFIPLIATTYVVVVNNDAYRYLPGTVSLSQMDWIDFADWMTNITGAQGEGKLCIAGAPGTDVAPIISSSMLAYGGAYPDYNSEPAREVWSLWISISDAISQPGLTVESCADLMRGGSALVSIMDISDAVPVFDQIPDRFTILTLPTGPEGRFAAGDMYGIGMMSGAPDPEIAGVFIEYLTREENLLKLGTHASLNIPTMRGIRDLLTLSPRDRLIRVGLLTTRTGTIYGRPDYTPESLFYLSYLYETIFTDMVVNGDGMLDEELLASSAEILAEIEE